MGWIKRVLWTESPETQAERKLLAKIDWSILSYFCISFFVNYLDRQAFTNAYVTGMSDDLHLVKNEDNVINTCLSVGYIISQIPHALLLQKIPLRYYFLANQVLWAISTMATAACKTYPQVCVSRFFLGIFEASTFSGANYVMGSWYKQNEIGKRTGLFATSGMAGQMISGYVQVGIHASLDGTFGRAGWQWMFLIDGIITLVAMYGVFVIPETPTTTKSFYLSEEEITLSKARLPPPLPNTKLDMTLLQRVLLDWKFYIFSMLWVIGGALEAISNQGTMIMYLKTASQFSLSQVNELPTAVQAVGIFVTLVATICIDLLPKHKWIFGVGLSTLQLIAASILLKWNVSIGVKLFAYYLAGTSYGGQPIYFTWANEICSGDDPLRSIVLFSMNLFSSVLFCFWGILLYPVTDAPMYHKGMITSICISIALAAWCALTKTLSDKTVQNRESVEYEVEKEVEI